MARTDDPQTPRPRHLFLVPAPAPRPLAVPLLRPNEPISPAHDALLTAIAHRARHGDRNARDLLWRAFAPRLEPSIRRCRRMLYRGWPWRNDSPWELEDLRQEAWLVFVELIIDWHGEGSFVAYVTAYFPWRLRQAMRRLAPTRRGVPLFLAAFLTYDDEGLLEAEREALLAAIAAELSPLDKAILRWRVVEDLSPDAMARRLGITRRSVTRRWTRIRRVARDLLAERMRGVEASD